MCLEQSQYDNLQFTHGLYKSEKDIVRWNDVKHIINKKNPLYEITRQNKDICVYIDIDGQANPNIDEKKFNENVENVNAIFRGFEDDFVFMTASKYNHKVVSRTGETNVHKYSWRLTYKKYINCISKMAKYVEKHIFPDLRDLLIGTMDLTYGKDESKKFDYLNIDPVVYRLGFGKMRTINAYKTKNIYELDRTNIKVNGDIEDHLIHFIKDTYESIPLGKEYVSTEEPKKTILPKMQKLPCKESRTGTLPCKESRTGTLPCKESRTGTLACQYDTKDPIVILLFEYLKNKNISFKDYTTIGLTLKNNDYPMELFYDWAQLSEYYKDENKDNTPVQWEQYHSRYYPIWTIYKVLKTNNPDKWNEYKKRFLDTQYFISLEDFNKGETQIMKVLLPVMRNEVVYSQKRFYILNKTTQLWEKVDNIMYYISNIVHKFIDHSVYKIADKVNDEEDKEKKEELRKQVREYKKAYKTSSSSGFLSCIQKHCKVALYDKSFYDKLDSSIDIICFKNGLYDLKLKEFRPIYDKDYVSKTLDYDYKPSNEKDKKYVRDILYKICNANKEHLEYYLSILGHSLTGHSKVKSLYFFFGEKGNNGKTTFLDILTTIFPIYVCKSNRDLVMKKSNDKHKFVADLHGKRVVWIDELTTSKLDTSFLKEYADGRSVQYKVMYGETATLQVRSKLFMITNHTPKYDNDGGMEKRIKLLKFNSEFSEDTEEDDYDNLRFKGDTELSKKIIKDYKYALIELLFEFANLYYTEGIKPYPQDFQDEKNILTEDNDKFNSWFDENFEKDGCYKFSKKEMDNCLLYFKRQNMSFSEVKDGLTRLGYKYDRELNFGYVQGKQSRGGWKGFRLIQINNDINNGTCNIQV